MSAGTSPTPDDAAAAEFKRRITAWAAAGEVGAPVLQKLQRHRSDLFSIASNAERAARRDSAALQALCRGAFAAILPPSTPVDGGLVPRRECIRAL